MKKDLIFFGTEGLTSTSANYIANTAKEYTQSLQKALNNIRFYRKTVRLIGSDNESVIEEGLTENELNQFSRMLKELAQAKSLIAWLREAIKARENMVKKIYSMSAGDYYNLKGIKLLSPVMEESITEEDYFGNMSIKERNRYYQLETEAAVLGQFIHPDGAFSNARDEMKQVHFNPHVVSGAGRDALIYDYTLSIDSDKVEAVFFELQNKYREVQSALNSIKFECQTAIEKSQLEVFAKYEKELAEYKDKAAVYHAEFETYKKEELSKLRQLKIVIPDSLRDIYTIVSKLGKNK